MEKNIQLKQIYEILDIETDKKIEKEWSWFKILTRLIMYPLSFILIIVNIMFIIPRGQYILTIISLGLVGDTISLCGLKNTNSKKNYR